MSGYARATKVPVDRSRFQIEHILTRYGAEQFAYATKKDGAMIGFRVEDRNIRISVPFPDKTSRVFTHSKSGYELAENQVESRIDQEVRRRWRALLLVIQAKLEAVDSGIAEFETEFLPYIVLPGGQTVAEKALPSVARAYNSGKDVPLLPSGGQ